MGNKTRYKLKLPIKIGIIDSQWEFLKKIDGKIVKAVNPTLNEYVEVSQWNYDYPVFKVMKIWLVEEPPEKSAFQEWNDSMDGNLYSSKEHRKEGWNAFGEALKKEISESCMKHFDSKILIERIDKLKEP